MQERYQCNRKSRQGTNSCESPATGNESGSTCLIKMVHYGPAKGCTKCKLRHVKVQCDLNKPKCQNCVRQQIECPGYGHQLDIFLRDQTHKVQNAYKNSHRRQKKTSLLNEISQSTFSDSMMKEGACSWFLSTFIGQNKDWRTSHGHFDHVLPLFKSNTSNCLITSSVTWLSLLMIGTSFRGEPYALEYEMLSKTICSLKDAIKYDTRQQSEEIFLVIILLQFGEDIRSRRYLDVREQKYTHQQAAEALVRQALQHRSTPVLRSLVSATRQNAVLYKLLDPRRRFDRLLWTRSNYVATSEINVETPAQRLDACGVTLLALEEQILREVNEHGQLLTTPLYQQSLQVLYELQCWVQSVPVEWRRQRVGDAQDTYLDPSVCYLFSQCYLLQLKAMIQLSWSRIHGKQLEEQLPALLDSIIALEYGFLDDIEPVEDIECCPNCIASTLLPLAKLSSCRSSPLGSRFLDLTLRIFVNMLQEIMALNLPSLTILHKVEMCARWANRELRTLRLAYPANLNPSTSITE